MAIWVDNSNSWFNPHFSWLLVMVQLTPEEGDEILSVQKGQKEVATLLR